MTRSPGRCAKGERLRIDYPRVTIARPPRLSQGRARPAWSRPWCSTARYGDWFEAYVTQAQVPGLRPGDVVMMDNLSSHKQAAVKEQVEAARVTLRFLQPTAPTSIPSRKHLLA
ncbi:hypothetical protein ABIC65_000560 [Sphingomonas trueperi]|uniref:transposase n=1 Tax=Sphingomonas trueperi TaxID=53317 RepID=UPI00347BEB7F